MTARFLRAVSCHISFFHSLVSCCFCLWLLALVWLFSLSGSVSTRASRHASLHQLHHQIKHQKETSHPILHVPEVNNNVCGKPCLSEHCRAFSSHAPHVRRCLSVSTSVATSIDANQQPSPNPHPRLYARHTSSRQPSLSPRPHHLHHIDDAGSTGSSLGAAEGFLRSETFSNYDFPQNEFDASVKSPPATYSYIKSFFRRVKTPEPEGHHPPHFQERSISVTTDALASNRLITDAVSMGPPPQHSTLQSQHSRPCEFASSENKTTSFNMSMFLCRS